MDENNEIAPHVEDIARVLGDKIDVKELIWKSKFYKD